MLFISEKLQNSKIITVPNALSLLRILLIPLIFWLIVNINDFFGVILLIIAATTDFLDGFLARKLNQVSALGQMLDPFADRLFIFFMLFALYLREIFPLWFLLIVLMREAILFIYFSIATFYRYELPKVTQIGKIGAASIMIGVSILYLTTCAYSYRLFSVANDGLLTTLCALIFILTCIGVAVYYLSGYQYSRSLFNTAYLQKNWTAIGASALISSVVFVIFMYYTIIAIPFAQIFGTL